jgi:prepilin-type N-terminal cleavage/methylation domain-containing protein
MKQKTLSTAGFSLIEMIGVLAIMAIMASVIVPNALKSLDRAAIRAEAANLDALGEQLKLYLRDNGALPTTAIPNASPNWTTQLASYADLSPTDLLTNKRNNHRVYLVDPAAPGGRRAIILSSMRDGFTLPAATSIITAARFDDIWQTADGSLPTATSWSGWTSAPWSTTANAGDYLLIERVNLASIYLTDLQTYTVTLNNISGATTTTTTTTENGNGNGGPSENANENANGGNANGGTTTTTTTTSTPAVTASFGIVFADGTVQATANIASGATLTTTTLRAGDRLNLYNDTGGTTLGYTHVVKDAGGTFDFNGTQWLPR